MNKQRTLKLSFNQKFFKNKKEEKEIYQINKIYQIR